MGYSVTGHNRCWIRDEKSERAFCALLHKSLPPRFHEAWLMKVSHGFLWRHTSLLILSNGNHQTGWLDIGNVVSGGNARVAELTKLFQQGMIGSRPLHFSREWVGGGGLTC